MARKVRFEGMVTVGFGVTLEVPDDVAEEDLIDWFDRQEVAPVAVMGDHRGECLTLNGGSRLKFYPEGCWPDVTDTIEDAG